MKIKPLNNYVAFKWLEKKASKIVLPQTITDVKLSKGEYYIGQCLAVGPKVLFVKPKDFFIFSEYSVINFARPKTYDEIFFIEEENIAAIINKPALIFRLDRLESYSAVEE